MSLSVKIIMSSAIILHVLQSGEFAITLETEMGNIGKGGSFQTNSGSSLCHKLCTFCL